MLFYYVYVLESLADGNHYVGSTHNLRRRIEEHEKGRNFATKFRRPFNLIYFEGCLHSDDAKRREKYLKTHQGRKFTGLRLKEYTAARALGGGC